MNDRELFMQLKKKNLSVQERKRLEEILWVRYQNLIHKTWHGLRKMMNNSPQVLEAKDDFYSEAYIAMKKGIKAIKLDRVRDDNWKFLGFYRLYLKSVRSKIANQIIKEYRKEKDLEYTDDSGKEVYIEEVSDILVSDESKDPANIAVNNESQARIKRIVDLCMSEWNEPRRTIFEMREAGVPKKKIADFMGVGPATVSYYLKKMRSDIEKHLYERA